MIVIYRKDCTEISFENKELLEAKRLLDNPNDPAGMIDEWLHLIKIDDTAHPDGLSIKRQTFMLLQWEADKDVFVRGWTLGQSHKFVRDSYERFRDQDPTSWDWVMKQMSLLFEDETLCEREMTDEAYQLTREACQLIQNPPTLG